ncbi:VOC family protein [Nocardia jejuensis]|uniref:VOC family protein n=1 Tax=Nocardia jejuensis TaxID=328049 RepID=UPI00082EB2B3|nr:VOC family protein [Nocardia jejuensis]
MTFRLNVVGLIVADMAASVAFYRLLGVEFAPGAEQERHAEAALGGGVRLTLDTEETIRSFHPEWTAVAGAGRIGLAVECESPAAVDAAFEALTTAGHHGELKPFDAFWGQRYAAVQDPDGNGVDLYAALS